MSAIKPNPNAQRLAHKLRDITDRQFKADPYPFYASLRAQHPVYRARMGKLDAWLVTRYDDVVAVLKDERLVKAQRSVQSEAQQAQRPWVPAFARPLESNMLDQDDPHTQSVCAAPHRTDAGAHPGAVQQAARRHAGASHARPGPRLCAAAAADGQVLRNGG